MHTDYFNLVKSAVEGGEDINRLTDGISMLSIYLGEYYSEVQSGNANDERWHVGGELALPLQERKSQVYEHLQWFAENGADFAAGEEDFPLMSAVGLADAPMAEFLLAHGADPFYDSKESGGCGNWYVEELDIIALNLSLEGDASEAEFDAILKTAAVLGKYGVRGRGNFSVEIEDDSVKLRQANVKF